MAMIRTVVLIDRLSLLGSCKIRRSCRILCHGAPCTGLVGNSVSVGMRPATGAGWDEKRCKTKPIPFALYHGGMECRAGGGVVGADAGTGGRGRSRGVWPDWEGQDDRGELKPAKQSQMALTQVLFQKSIRLKMDCR